MNRGRSHRWSGIGAAVVAIGLLAPLQALPAGAQAPPGPPNQAQLRRQLVDATGGRARLADHPGTGRLRFFGTEREAAVGRPRDVPANATPEAAARGFLATYGPLFGADDQARQLRLSKVQDAGSGRSAVRFQQLHNGAPVIAGDLVVNLDQEKRVLSVNGELRPGLDVGVEPGVPVLQAANQARALIARERDLDEAGLEVSDPTLWIFDPVLLGGPQLGGPRLVWRMEVTSDAEAALRELVLVDAKTGAVVVHFDQIGHAKDRKICDRNSAVDPDETCVAPYTREEAGAPSGISDVDLAYDYSGIVYDYFLANFGRDSLDGAGMPLISTVRFCAEAGACPYQNAFWNGSQMTYGEGFADADDVVGHEFAHGITEFTSNLFYYYQSGAINESMSDVFGELIDLTDGVGDDSPGVRWIVGEDLPIGAIRSMADPPGFGDPDSMASTLYATGTGDGGGVHTNSGVNNKTAYLLTDGGTFNGVTVAGLGTTKVGHIYYEASANLLTSGSDYQDLYEVLQQACFNKVGTVGITAANCGEVKKAVTATKMNQPAPGGGALEAPICDAGDTPADLFFDDMENTGSGNWTFSGTGEGGFDYASGYATSGDLELYAPNPDADSDRTATRSAAVVPPVGKTTYLLFNHAYSTEPGYDGGVLEISTDGGSSWSDAGSHFVDNGYNRTNHSGPFAGRAVFGGVSMGYGSSRLDLSAFAGQSVRYRFRLASDFITGALGWLIDDVRVYTCGLPAPSFSISDVSVAEGRSGTAQATFKVKRSGDTSGTASVNYASGAGTATAGTDYVSVAPTTLTFVAGEATKNVSVNVNGDASREPDETFVVNLSSPVNAVIADGQGTGTIVNDDGLPVLRINDVAVTEGNAGTAAATFTITRSGDLSATSSVKYATGPAQATAGSDYVHVPTTTVNFAVGETTKTVGITVNGDTVVEGHENFLVALSTPVGATIGDSIGLGTITNDDAGVAPTISINDVTVNEGNAGTTAANFTITRSGSTAQAASVTYTTASGTAAAGGDYTALAATPVNFAIGEVTKPVTVNITGDVVDEANETFFVNLSAPVNATLSDTTGVGTIVDDDGPVTPGPSTFLSVNDVTVTEGNAGFTNATFTITRSGVTTGASSVQYKTFQGTARLGTDLVLVNDTTVNFAAGETTKTATVQVYGDVIPEGHENFVVSLRNPSGATIADDIGLGIVTNDDAGTPASLWVDDVTVGEGNAGTTGATFTVTRSGSSAEPVTVNYSTVAGTATSGTDYLPVSSTSLIFAEGEVTKTVSVAVSGDAAREPSEDFSVKLTLPVGAAIADDTGLATIANDDPLPQFTVGDATLTEGNVGTKTLTFMITRVGDTSAAGAVTVATANGTATAGQDYVAFGPAVWNFAANQVSRTVSVTLKGDSVAEANETVLLNLSAPSGGTVSDAQAVGSIINDD